MGCSDTSDEGGLRRLPRRGGILFGWADFVDPRHELFSEKIRYRHTVRSGNSFARFSRRNRFELCSFPRWPNTGGWLDERDYYPLRHEDRRRESNHSESLRWLYFSDCIFS